jgi:hypothetical protein
VNIILKSYPYPEYLLLDLVIVTQPAGAVAGHVDDGIGARSIPSIILPRFSLKGRLLPSGEYFVARDSVRRVHWGGTTTSVPRDSSIALMAIYALPI